MHFLSLLFILFEHSTCGTDIKSIKRPSEIQYEIPTDEPSTIIFRGTGIITKSIGKAAQNMKKIIIEEGITEIDDDAFYRQIWPEADDQNFIYEEIELPRSLIKIGNRAFSISGRNLNKVHFPEYKPEVSENDIPEAELESFYSLRQIGIDAFANQKLTTHNIPGTFVEIGTRAFQQSRLTHIRLNSKMISIPSYTFMGCEFLTEVILPESLTSVYSNAFMNCKQLSKVTWKAQECTLFGYDAFYGCSSLTEFKFPSVGSGFQGFGEYFGNCYSLKRCVFPRTITDNSMGTKVFINCGNLKEVVFPSNINSIPSEFFMNSSIETAFLPESVSVINSRAFKDCKQLKYVHISNKMTVSIESDAFEGTANIEVMVIDGNITSLNRNAITGKAVCYNGLINPTSAENAINSTLTTIYLTQEFRSVNQNQNFGFIPDEFVGFPYQIQEGDVCSLPEPQPSPSSQIETQPDEDDSKNDKDKGNGGLSTLFIVLISVCALAVVLIIVVVVIVVVYKRKSSGYVADATTDKI